MGISPFADGNNEIIRMISAGGKNWRYLLRSIAIFAQANARKESQAPKLFEQRLFSKNELATNFKTLEAVHSCVFFAPGMKYLIFVINEALHCMLPSNPFFPWHAMV